MTIQEIKDELLKGNQFGNDASNWFTICNLNKFRMIIMIQDSFKTYKNINSYAKRIQQLINRGF